MTLGKTNLPSYRGFQVKLTTPSALPYTNRPGTQEVVWLDCQTPYENASQPPMYLAGCNRFTAPNPSTYLGPVLEVDYRCGASSTQVYTITMLQGALEDATYLVDNNAHSIDPEGGRSKTMTIRCHPSTPVAVGGVAQLTTIAEQAIDARDAGSSARLAIGLAVAVATVLAGTTLRHARLARRARLAPPRRHRA